MSWWRVVWVNVLVTAALLVAIEGGCRIAHPVGFPDPLIASKRADWSSARRYDPLLFWSMQPGVERSGERLTNSLGLRGPEVGPKAEDEFRILSLGESTTFGIRLPYEKTYSARLQTNLTEVDGRTVRVVNAGVPGYSLLQGFVYLKYRGLDLEPDAVLLYFGFNDFLPIAFRTQRDSADNKITGGLTDRELFAIRQRPFHRLSHALARHSNFVRYLLFHRGQAGTELTTSTEPRVPESDRWQLLIDIKRLAAENDVRLVIIAPWYLEFEEHLQLLRQFSEAQGVPLIDLNRRLESSLPQSRAVYFADEIHPNDTGHDVIATAIADELRSIWGISGSS